MFGFLPSINPIPASSWPSPSKSTATGVAAEKLLLRPASKGITWDSHGHGSTSKRRTHPSGELTSISPTPSHVWWSCWEFGSYTQARTLYIYIIHIYIFNTYIYYTYVYIYYTYIYIYIIHIYIYASALWGLWDSCLPYPNVRQVNAELLGRDPRWLSGRSSVH